MFYAISRNRAWCYNGKHSVLRDRQLLMTTISEQCEKGLFFYYGAISCMKTAEHGLFKDADFSYI